jgi:hypothetical protein
MFGFRPTPALSGYRVPGLAGLYLAGASTHPGGGVSGNSGRTAARTVLGDRGVAVRAREVLARGLARVRKVTGLLVARPGSRSAALPWVPAVLLVLTAIAYPLLDPGAARDAVSWAIVLLGSAVSVTAAGVAHGARTGAALLAWSRSPRWPSSPSGWPPGTPTARTPTATCSGPTLLGVPFLVPLAWLMMAWPSRVLAGPAHPPGAAGTAAGRPGRRRRGRVRRVGRRPRPAAGAGRLLDVGAPHPGAARASTPCR